MADATFWQEAQVIFGNRISKKRTDCESHGQSETWFPLTPPEAVAFPETTEEVAALTKICAAHRVALVGWGRGPRWKAMLWRLRAGSSSISAA